MVACVRLAVGGREVAREVRTFASTTAGLLGPAERPAENGCTHVVMKATGVCWKPVWHVLAEGGFVPAPADAAQVRSVPGRETDVGDATWPAELLAHGLVRAGSVPDGPTRELRALLRTREQPAARVPAMPVPAEDAPGRPDPIRGRQRRARRGPRRPAR